MTSMSPRELAGVVFGQLSQLALRIKMPLIWFKGKVIRIK